MLFVGRKPCCSHYMTIQANIIHRFDPRMRSESLLTGSSNGPPLQSDSMFSCVTSLSVPPGIIAVITRIKWLFKTSPIAKNIALCLPSGISHQAFNAMAHFRQSHYGRASCIGCILPGHRHQPYYKPQGSCDICLLTYWSTTACPSQFKFGIPSGATYC